MIASSSASPSNVTRLRVPVTPLVCAEWPTNNYWHRSTTRTVRFCGPPFSVTSFPSRSRIWSGASSTEMAPGTTSARSRLSIPGSCCQAFAPSCMCFSCSSPGGLAHSRRVVMSKNKETGSGLKQWCEGRIEAVHGSRRTLPRPCQNKGPHPTAFAIFASPIQGTVTCGYRLRFYR